MGKAKVDNNVLLELIQTFKPLIKKYSSLLNMNYEDAISELTLEFIKIVKSFPAKKDCASDKYILSYISKSMRNTYITKSIELEKLKIVYFEDSFNWEPACFQYSSLWINELLLELTSTQKKVLLLRYYYGYSVVEISKQLSISRQAVNQAKNRGLIKLKQMLTKDC
jgi:RNA polymerase sigma-70 factor (ECF subfamily)